MLLTGTAGVPPANAPQGAKILAKYCSRYALIAGGTPAGPSERETLVARPHE